MRRLIPVTLEALLLALLILAPCQAGNGFIRHGAQGRELDLTVFFDHPRPDLGAWKACFTEANRILWRVTDGHLRLGEVRMGTDPATQRLADVQAGLEGEDYVSGDTHGSSLGTSEKLYMHATTLSNPVTLVHEIGHYVFGLWDEYQGTAYALRHGEWEEDGQTDYREGLSCAVPYQSPASPTRACIMYDSHTPDRYANFCLDGTFEGAHVLQQLVRDHGGLRLLVSSQQEKHKVSCWTVIARFLGIPVPTAPPDRRDEPPAPPRFRPLSAQAILVILVQDSPTMGRHVASARRTASRAVRQLRLAGADRPGDMVALLAFGRSPRPVLPPTTLDTLASLEAAQQSVSHLTLSRDREADLGAALREALALVKSLDENRPEGFASRTILVVTDGRVSPLPPEEAKALRADNIAVDIVSFGEAPPQRIALEALAHQTLGDFRSARGEGLPDRPVGGWRLLFGARGRHGAEETGAEAGLDAVGGYVVGRYEGVLGRASHRVIVDPATDVVRFALLTPGAAQPVLVLTDPTGRSLRSDEIIDGVTIERDVGRVTMRVEDPPSGTWSVRAEAMVRTAWTRRYALAVFGEGETLASAVGSWRPAEAPPRRVLLSVRLGSDRSIIGSRVIVSVTRPDGVRQVVALHDDGEQARHGDVLAKDGVYSNYFDDLSRPGTYRVEAQALCRDGQYTTRHIRSETWRGALPLGPVGRAPDFQRVLESEFVVEAAHRPWMRGR